MIRIALVGCNDDALTLLRAVSSNPETADGERLVVEAAYDVPDEMRAAVAGVAPRVRLAERGRPQEQWESLIHGTVADLAIVAGLSGLSAKDGRSGESPSPSERVAEQLRKLVQALPVVVVQPACEAIVAYELDMIRSDSQFPLLPFVPGFDHPGVRRLAELSDGRSSLGAIRQVVFSADCRSDHRDDVLAQLVKDMAIIRSIVGHMTEMTATGVTYGRAEYDRLSVSLQSAGEIAVRWNVEPSAQRRLTVIGEYGSLELRMGGTPAEWELVTIRGAIEAEASRDAASDLIAEKRDYDWPADELKALLRRLQRPPTDAWLDACRDLEIADMVDYSLRRGRKVNLISDAPSEEGTFKGVMAAGGCLLLLLAFVAVIGLSMVEGFRYPANRNEWESRRAATTSADDSAPAIEERRSLWLRIWPVYPLLLFLMLQLFRAFAKPAETRTDPQAKRLTRGAPPAQPDNQPAARNTPDGN